MPIPQRFLPATLTGNDEYGLTATVSWREEGTYPGWPDPNAVLQKQETWLKAARAPEGASLGSLTPAFSGRSAPF